MKLVLIYIMTTIRSLTFGQDGSDIKYVSPDSINSSYLGRTVQFDFYNRSFGGRNLDTVVIVIGRKPVVFVEDRNDDGYENRFSQQRLVSVKECDDNVLSISKLVLQSVTQNSFEVIMQVDYYESNMGNNLTKSMSIVHWFNKEDIVEVLIKQE
jgi:hypothetical protein